MKATNITQIQEQINDIVALINSSLPPIQTKSEHFKNVIDTAAKMHHQLMLKLKELNDAFKTKDYDGVIRHMNQLNSYGDNCSRITKDEKNSIQKAAAQEFNAQFYIFTDKGDMKQILRYTDLLCRLGFHDSAIKQYLTYYTGIIVNEASMILEKLDAIDFHRFSLKLISRQTNIKAVDVFGEDTYCYIVQSLNKQINSSTISLVESFERIRRLSVLQTQRNVKDFPEQDVLITLDEISLISNVVIFYNEYFQDIYDKINSNTQQQNEFVESKKKIYAKLDKLLNAYISLEEAYLSIAFTRNIKDRLKLNEFGEALDLIFYVLQQSAERVVITKSFQTVCAIINLQVNTIKTYLLDLAKTLVKDNTSFTKVLSKDAITCLDSCEANIIKLHSTLSLKVNTLWRSNPRYIEMVSVTLDELLETKDLFSALIQ
ncbi:Conserved oligomeric Golgi complex subunit 4 [Entamoeba marina]